MSGSETGPNKTAGFPMVKRFALAASFVLALAACQDDGFSRSSRHPVANSAGHPGADVARRECRRTIRSSSAPTRRSRRWRSGSAAPTASTRFSRRSRSAAGRASSGRRRREGDRQAPEGFYTITPAPDESELGLLPVLRHRLSERLRPRLRPHRRGLDGARLLLVARLLRDDGRGDRRGLCRSPARPSPAASALSSSSPIRSG